MLLSMKKRAPPRSTSLPALENLYHSYQIEFLVVKGKEQFLTKKQLFSPHGPTPPGPGRYNFL